MRLKNATEIRIDTEYFTDLAQASRLCHLLPVNPTNAHWKTER